MSAAAALEHLVVAETRRHIRDHGGRMVMPKIDTSTIFGGGHESDPVPGTAAAAAPAASVSGGAPGARSASHTGATASSVVKPPSQHARQKQISPNAARPQQQQPGQRESATGGSPSKTRRRQGQGQAQLLATAKMSRGEILRSAAKDPFDYNAGILKPAIQATVNEEVQRRQHEVRETGRRNLGSIRSTREAQHDNVAPHQQQRVAGGLSYSTRQAPHQQQGGSPGLFRPSSKRPESLSSAAPPVIQSDRQLSSEEMSAMVDRLYSATTRSIKAKQAVGTRSEQDVSSPVEMLINPSNAVLRVSSNSEQHRSLGGVTAACSPLEPSLSPLV